MTTQTQETTKAEQTEVAWSKAQLRHFAKLNGEIEQAKRDLEKAEGVRQEYLNYLVDEYSLDTSKAWVVGPQGFVLAPEKAAKPPAPTDSTAATDDGQTPPQE